VEQHVHAPKDKALAQGNARKKTKEKVDPHLLRVTGEHVL
jgi:hypothetical protein